MKVHFPHHAPLIGLLKKEQYEACRAIADEMISGLMGAPSDDRELACLHLVLCLAQFHLGRHRLAAEKADIAAFLARKAGDVELLEHAHYLAGAYYQALGDYGQAVERLTECLSGSTRQYRAEALYNRGFAYHSVGAFDNAIPDYEEAAHLAGARLPELARRSRINLAWVLVLNGDYERAEAMLNELAQSAAETADDRLQAQVAHDRAHMALLQGKDHEALRLAWDAVRKAGGRFPHVQARLALTLMELAIRQDLPDAAFTLGTVAKRLAGAANRADIDHEAGRQMRKLELREGTDCLVESLLKMGQVLPGATERRRAPRYRQHRAGGAG